MAGTRLLPIRTGTRFIESVKLAIEFGGDANAVNIDGKTALDAAKALKYESVVKYLAEQGAGR